MEKLCKSNLKKTVENWSIPIDSRTNPDLWSGNMDDERAHAQKMAATQMSFEPFFEEPSQEKYGFQTNYGRIVIDRDGLWRIVIE